MAPATAFFFSVHCLLLVPVMSSTASETIQPSRASFIFKLNQVQVNAKAAKAQRNQFANYDFRNCEDIMQALKPHLDGLAVVISDDIIEVAGRVYIKATVTVTDGVNEISNSAFAREAEVKKGMDVSQLTGACSSYARKYALSGMFMIDNNKDADHFDNRGGPGGGGNRPAYNNQQQNNQAPVAAAPAPAVVTPSVINQKQCDSLVRGLTARGKTEADFCTAWQMGNISELQVDNLKAAVEWIKSIPVPAATPAATPAAASSTVNNAVVSEVEQERRASIERCRKIEKDMQKKRVQAHSKPDVTVSVEPVEEPETVVTDAQIGQLRAAMKDAQMNEYTFCGFAKINKIYELESKYLTHWIEWLNKKADEYRQSLPSAVVRDTVKKAEVNRIPYSNMNFYERREYDRERYSAA